MDGYLRCVMRFAEDGLRIHALKCLGKSYFGVEKGYVERCTDRRWEELVKGGVGWELGHDGVSVIIRRIKKP